VTHRSFVFLVIFIGVGVGSTLRHAVNRLSAHAFGLNFPYGTLVVNLVGSFLMGALAGWFALRGGHTQSLLLFLTTGLVGGFTTFSAFSLDAVLLWERGEMGSAAIYVGLSVLGAVLGVLFGLVILRSLLS
jgi:CrcB protein